MFYKRGLRDLIQQSITAIAKYLLKMKFTIVFLCLALVAASWASPNRLNTNVAASDDNAITYANSGLTTPARVPTTERNENDNALVYTTANPNAL